MGSPMPEGWYQDPDGHGSMRLWDGQKWIRHRRKANDVELQAARPAPPLHRENTQMTDLEWHPDPSGRHELRHWDGQRWTSYVMDHGVPTEDHHGASPPPPPSSLHAPASSPPSTLGTAVKWGFGLAAGWTMFLLVAVVLLVGGCGALIDSSG